YEQALTAGTAVTAPRGQEAGSAGQPGLPGVPNLVMGPTGLPMVPPAQGLDRSSALAQMAPGLGGMGGEDSDPNKQLRKEQFANTPRSDFMSGSTRVRPRSQYELKTGAVVPAVAISGINSDLPGQILAQVSQNVYDSATGQFLLIPQGSKLVGTYDAQVAYGQRRVLVAWTRVVFPDASTLDLGNMPGASGAGYAGFEDEVNNHYGRVFGAALLMSIIGAGAQLSQPDAPTGETYSSQQILAAELGRSINQVGQQITQKNLNIQPTLEIRPGYRFNVMVTKDLVLPPYRVAR
ncbi:TrbI/VirB10 family protein, partial [Xanthomonas phaseoli]